LLVIQLKLTKKWRENLLLVLGINLSLASKITNCVVMVWHITIMLLLLGINLCSPFFYPSVAYLVGLIIPFFWSLANVNIRHLSWCT
jgi:hypothetical protein